MNRRGFLGAMLGAMAAPAIAKAENLMKIFVPPEKKIFLGRGMSSLICQIDELGFVGELEGLSVDKFTDIQKAIIDSIRDHVYETYRTSALGGAHPSRKLVNAFINPPSVLSNQRPSLILRA